MISYLDAIGWIGSFCFAVCAIPQAWKCYQEKNGNGLSWPFILLWLVGEVFTFIYIWPKRDWPLLFNYTVNLSALFVIIYYMLWPTRKSSTVNTSDGSS